MSYSFRQRPEFATITFAQEDMIREVMRNAPHKQHERPLLVKLFQGEKESMVSSEIHLVPTHGKNK